MNLAINLDRRGKGKNKYFEVQSNQRQTRTYFNEDEQHFLCDWTWERRSSARRSIAGQRRQRKQTRRRSFSSFCLSAFISASPCQPTLDAEETFSLSRYMLRIFLRANFSSSSHVKLPFFRFSQVEDGDLSWKIILIFVFAVRRRFGFRNNQQANRGKTSQTNRMIDSRRYIGQERGGRDFERCVDPRADAHWLKIFLSSANEEAQIDFFLPDRPISVKYPFKKSQ